MPGTGSIPADGNGVGPVRRILHPGPDTARGRPRRFGVECTRGGAIKLMHRPGFGYVRPKPLPRQADRAAREAFMRKYERPMRDAPANEAIVLPDASIPNGGAGRRTAGSSGRTGPRSGPPRAGGA